MSERYLYGGDNQFKGSIDDDGRIYDRNHWIMGHVENGTIYDNYNIPQGRITDGGMVLDTSCREIGQEYGTGFCAPAPRREMGYVRADILSEGHGSDYGAFHLLDRNQRHGYDPCPDDDDADGTDEDRDDDIYVPTPRAERRAGRGNMDESFSPENNPGASCVGCGCAVLFVIGILTVLRMCS
jgi:hypothetical protein